RSACATIVGATSGHRQWIFGPGSVRAGRLTGPGRNVHCAVVSGPSTWTRDRGICEGGAEMSYANGSIAETSEAAPGLFESEYTEAEALEQGELEVPAYEDSFAGESPFVAGKAFDGPGAAGFAGDLHELLAELYDSEFDRQLMELSDAAAEAAGESPFTQGE